MIEFYTQIKVAHIALVLGSGGLFALRGLALLLGQSWSMAAPMRYLSYAIDTCLLTAALMLLVVLKLNPFMTPWLAVKLALLLLYIVLGSMAFRRADRNRVGWYLAALVCFGFMYSVAIAHHPLGVFTRWLA